MAHQPNYVVLDVETGGLSAFENPITEFAMLSCEGDSLKEINRYSSFVKPYEDLTITQQALDFTMVDMADINKGVDHTKLVEITIQFLKEANPTGKARSKPILVGHNIVFDLMFLKVLFQLCKKDFNDYVANNDSETVYMDTLVMARLKWIKLKASEVQSYTLSSCCNRAGIDIANAHGALNDVIATWKLLQYYSGTMMKNEMNSVEIDEEGVEETDKPRQFFKF